MSLNMAISVGLKVFTFCLVREVSNTLSEILEDPKEIVVRY